MMFPLFIQDLRSLAFDFALSNPRVVNTNDINAVVTYLCEVIEFNGPDRILEVADSSYTGGPLPEGFIKHFRS